MNISPEIGASDSRSKILKRIGISIVLSLFIGGIFTQFAGFSPIQMIKTLFSSGFGCKAIENCALFTALQFATPLIFAGLSAAIAFRIGFFSIGQAGQMVIGAGFATWVGYKIFPPVVHPILAIVVAAIVGAIWAIFPVILKDLFSIHEIISSFIFNSIVGIPLGLLGLRWGNIEKTAQLSALAKGSKMNIGIVIAILAGIFVFYLLWHSVIGYKQRMVGQAPFFSTFGGINSKLTVYKTMMLSGAIAGIGGAIEVLGVHYKFINSFSPNTNFDGIMVALLGQGHPIGILFSGIFIGGIRFGSLNGLLIKEGIPRELGNTILAIMMIFLAFRRFSKDKTKI